MSTKMSMMVESFVTDQCFIGTVLELVRMRPYQLISSMLVVQKHAMVNSIDSFDNYAGKPLPLGIGAVDLGGNLVIAMEVSCNHVLD